MKITYDGVTSVVDSCESADGNKFEYVSRSSKDFNLPKRQTVDSAGYDICSPEDFEIRPGEIVEIKLQIKVKIVRGEFLLLVPRSSLGWKYNIRLVNTIGIIDRDYYNNPSNEGELGLKLKNDGDKALFVRKNDRLIQGIFVKYDKTIDDDVKEERIGGFGSTGTR